MMLEHRPDVVILDGRMPKLDGLAVLSAIKSDPELANILVAMLTGRGQLSDLERGMELGADAYFIKPFSQKNLHAWVEKNLKSRKGGGFVALTDPSQGYRHADNLRIKTGYELAPEAKILVHSRP